MILRYSPSVLRDFPELATGMLQVERITPAADASASVARLHAAATGRLAGGSESDLPEVQAWRRAFARMGLKPTQYRCASEALLRRFRKEGTLPALHPLVDLCNAASMAFAIPVAVFDLGQVEGALEVRHATGTERYETLAGEVEHPNPGEIIFADEAGSAHARRWTNRQSGRSAVRAGTSAALIVAEALHGTAREDVSRLTRTLQAMLAEAWPAATILEVRQP
ncbi:B3/B4 domain-containing protein [Microvirga sp. CF3016]|uniref:B3/B4 domain-containing protein n=1 Tax=Microvirga sp. CF3016 TaxID=3110181 RepID=UPI002E781826|nr:phenylalanine--tRNA ligase beta subunit-related protein [Microvirga sp. CF3016]MEE1611388.1 phenylalanine--tRNA ligase beta subunit-related protein [Microvirga sp. CF3016]